MMSVFQAFGEGFEPYRIGTETAGSHTAGGIHFSKYGGSWICVVVFPHCGGMLSYTEQCILYEALPK